ncbi:MAG TPA: MerR family transcriptional regulator [Actinomycetota bacterium]|nr:MerR family transcriptional regulator [Actinomycetota bacterium]
MPPQSQQDQLDLDLDKAEQGYRGPQVCKIVGISYRQLDYWARTSLVSPSVQPAQGSGSQRLYSFQDLLELKLIKNLLDAGISLQRVREAIDHLHALGHDLSGVTVASDGSSVYAYTSPQEVFDLLKRGQGVFAIAVDPVMKELEGSVSALRREEANEHQPAVADSKTPKALAEE